MKLVIYSNMINLVNIALSEICHVLNDQYFMFVLICRHQKVLMSNDDF